MSEKNSKKSRKKNLRLALILNILDEEYQTSVFSGIKKRCQEKNIDIICFQNEDPSSLSNTLITRFPGKDFFNVDGVILLTSVFTNSPSIHSKEGIEKLFKDIPVVSVGEKIEGIPSVSIRSIKAMNKLMDHLVNHHHYKKFVYMSGIEELVDSIDRKTIFNDYIEKHKNKIPDIECHYLTGHFNENAARSVITEYISQHPDNPADVIVCANDNMALGVYKYLKSQSTSPKWENVAVTGFDDIPEAALEMPAFTTVHQPLEEMGSKAVDVMIQTLNKEEGKENFVEAKLILRESCGCKMQNQTKTLSENQFNSIQRKFFQQEHQLRLLSRWGQQLNSATDLNELIYSLDSNLAIMGIDNFALFSFPLPPNDKKMSIEKKLASTSELFLRTNGERKTTYGQIKKGSLTDFLPELNTIQSNSLVVKFLSSSSGISGFIVYDSPIHMHPNICSISTNIAQTIYHIQTTEQREKYSIQLEKAVARRTKELIEENNKRVEVEAEVLKISEMERKRFSTDLHDDICQRLAGLAMLCRCYSSSDKPISTDQMVELTELITDTLQTTRQYAHNSFPVDLDSLGIKDSLSNLCNSFQTQSKCQCIYKWKLPENKQFTRPQAINIFRIVQEALQNIMKHAEATKVKVSIEKEKQLIVVRIADNGKGMQNGNNTNPGLGLKSMVYRADQINADFLAKPNSPKGTVIELTLPISKLENTD